MGCRSIGVTRRMDDSWRKFSTDLTTETNFSIKGMC